MTPEVAAQTMARARDAQARWAAQPLSERTRVLKRLRFLIAERMDEIIRVISSEIGKPAMDALTGDIMATLEQLRHDERTAPGILRERKLRKPPFLFSGANFVELREPFGVVLVVAPWNYPLQLSVIPLATALVAGNAVLLKCSESAPATAALILDLCTAAGFPDGLLQVSSDGPEAVRAWIEAAPDLIFLTGSTAAGKAIAAQAAERLIPLILELGGKDAAVVFDSCDLENAAAGVCYASFANAGQVCVAAKRIYVQSGIFERFVASFLREVGKLRAGDCANSDYGAIRVAGVEQRLRAQVQDALARGATLHTEWNEDGEFPPTVLSNVPPDSALLVHESFGAVVCVERFDNEAEAVRLANASAFALSASIWTRDMVQARRVASALCCGSCCVNDAIRHVGNPYASFGGNKASGFGRYRGPDGIRAFSRTKTLMLARGSGRRVHWFPFTERTFHRVRSLLRFRHGKGASRWTGMNSLFALLLLLVCSVAWGQPHEGDLLLRVRMPEHAKGRIAYLLFQSADGFPSDRERAVRRGFVDISTAPGTEQIVDVGNVAPGRYAPSVYLDENGNGRLDKNWIGMPEEPVGASNNPRPHAGPPRFNDCAFVHTEAAQTLSISLVECCRR